MKKTKTILMLPTDKADNCLLESVQRKLTFNDNQYFTQGYLKEVLHKSSHHLYITSDEEIELGGPFFHSKYNDILFATERDVDSQQDWRDEDYRIEKVLGSTDRNLSIGDFNEYKFPLIPLYITQTFISLYNINKQFSEVEIEYEWDQ